MRKRHLVTTLLGCLMAITAYAEGSRDSYLRKYVGDSSEAARQARLGKIYSSACSCTQGAPLSGTGSMVFNCNCGTMQCVVVANTLETGRGQTPNLVCR